MGSGHSGSLFELSSTQLQSGISEVAFQSADGKTTLLDFTVLFSH
ncbi:MAG: hypothetical protein PHQ75_10560 [Thermoguttaceae bacterium]|nr:hypothetical protein [Thermoguttaceae bacterium]